MNEMRLNASNDSDNDAKQVKSSDVTELTVTACDVCRHVTSRFARTSRFRYTPSRTQLKSDDATELN